MKENNFSDAQKAFILKRADERVPIGDVLRKAGINQAACTVWVGAAASLPRRSVVPPQKRTLASSRPEWLA